MVFPADGRLSTPSGPLIVTNADVRERRSGHATLSLHNQPAQRGRMQCKGMVPAFGGEFPRVGGCSPALDCPGSAGSNAARRGAETSHPLASAIRMNESLPRPRWKPRHLTAFFGVGDGQIVTI